MKDNERLEFLGDAVLNLIVGHMLMQSFPELKEGELSRIRAQLVNEKRLAAMARDINLGHHLKLGKGELQTDGRGKPSILADAFEAVVCTEVLEHLEEPEKALRELLRVTRRWVILSVPREPLWRVLNMVRGAYLRHFGNTPGHIGGFVERNFGKPQRLPNPADTIASSGLSRLTNSGLDEVRLP